MFFPPKRRKWWNTAHSPLTQIVADQGAGQDQGGQSAAVGKPLGELEPQTKRTKYQIGIKIAAAYAHGACVAEDNA